MKYSSGISMLPNPGRGIQTQCETGCWCVEGCLTDYAALTESVMPQPDTCEAAICQTTVFHHLFRLAFLAL